MKTLILILTISFYNQADVTAYSTYDSMYSCDEMVDEISEVISDSDNVRTFTVSCSYVAIPKPKPVQ